MIRARLGSSSSSILWNPLLAESKFAKVVTFARLKRDPTLSKFEVRLQHPWCVGVMFLVRQVRDLIGLCAENDAATAMRAAQQLVSFYAL